MLNLEQFFQNLFAFGYESYMYCYYIMFGSYEPEPEFLQAVPINRNEIPVLFWVPAG